MSDASDEDGRADITLAFQHSARMRARQGAVCLQAATAAGGHAGAGGHLGEEPAAGATASVGLAEESGDDSFVDASAGFGDWAEPSGPAGVEAPTAAPGEAAPPADAAVAMATEGADGAEGGSGTGLSGALVGSSAAPAGGGAGGIEVRAEAVEFTHLVAMTRLELANGCLLASDYLSAIVAFNSALQLDELPQARAAEARRGLEEAWKGVKLEQASAEGRLDLLGAGPTAEVEQLLTDIRLRVQSWALISPPQRISLEQQRERGEALHTATQESEGLETEQGGGSAAAAAAAAAAVEVTSESGAPAQRQRWQSWSEVAVVAEQPPPPHATEADEMPSPPHQPTVPPSTPSRGAAETHSRVALLGGEAVDAALSPDTLLWNRTLSDATYTGSASSLSSQHFHHDSESGTAEGAPRTSKVGEDEQGGPTSNESSRSLLPPAQAGSLGNKDDARGGLDEAGEGIMSDWKLDDQDIVPPRQPCSLPLPSDAAGSAALAALAAELAQAEEANKQLQQRLDAEQEIARESRRLSLGREQDLEARLQRQAAEMAAIQAAVEHERETAVRTLS
jgi:hypothetical protein